MLILLADDHGLFIEGLQSLLKTGGFEIAGIARSGMQALEMARARRPDVVLVDVRMPSGDGFLAIRLIKSELPEIRVVVLTGSTEGKDLFEAFRSGADGYLLKNLQPGTLYEYLNGLARGESPLAREMSSLLVHEFVRQSQQIENQISVIQPNSRLSSRQREILVLAAQGMTYKEIAAVVDLSEHTIKYHMGEVLQALHLHNREQAIAWALIAGLVHGKPSA